MSKKDSSFSQKDLFATIWATNFATFGLVLCTLLSTSLSTLILSSMLGAIIGQIFIRWLFKRDPSILEELGTLKPNAILKHSVASFLFLVVGLLLGWYILDESFPFLFVGGALVSAMLAFCFLSTIIARYLEQDDPD